MEHKKTVKSRDGTVVQNEDDRSVSIYKPLRVGLFVASINLEGFVVFRAYHFPNAGRDWLS